MKKTYIIFVSLCFITYINSFRSCASSLLQPTKQIIHNIAKKPNETVKHNFSGINSSAYPTDSSLLTYIDEQTTLLTRPIERILKLYAIKSPELFEESFVFIKETWNTFITQCDTICSDPRTESYSKQMFNEKIQVMLHKEWIQEKFKNQPLKLGNFLLELGLVFQAPETQLDYIRTSKII